MKSNRTTDGYQDAANELMKDYKDSKTAEITETPSLWFSKRFLVTVLLFFGCVNMYALRGNLSIAIVEMTSNKTIPIEGNQTIIRPPEFDWGSETVGIVISMFSYGYLWAIGGAYLSIKLGGAVTYGISMMAASLLTLLNPISLRLHFHLFLACRVVAGLFESFAYASTAEIFSRWAPVAERSTMMAYSFTGIYIGTAATYPFCGYLAHKWGWQMVFYVTGLISLAWSLLWLIFVRNDPSKDKWISKKELLYIQEGTENISRKEVVHPYKKILTSTAFWALAMAKFSYSVGFTILVTCFPLFVSDMTHRSTDEIGLISSIPHVVCIVMIPTIGIFMDYCRKNSTLKISQIHKILMTIGFTFGALLFIIAANITSFMISMICFVMIKVLLSFNFLILQLVGIAMAPKHSSAVAGLSAFWYTLSTILTPTVIGFIVKNHSLEEWSTCFLLSAGVLMFGAIFYVLYGSSEPQPWSNPPTIDLEDENKKALKK